MMNASQSTSFSSRQDIVIKAALLLLICCVHRQTQFICNAFTITPVVVVTSTPTAFSHSQQLHSSDNTVAPASGVYVSRVTTTTLWSSFYGKFEDFDLNEDGNDEDDDDDDDDVDDDVDDDDDDDDDDEDDDDDDDDDEYEKMDDRSIADFKSKISN